MSVYLSSWKFERKYSCTEGLHNWLLLFILVVGGIYFDFACIGSLRKANAVLLLFIDAKSYVRDRKYTQNPGKGTK